MARPHPWWQDYPDHNYSELILDAIRIEVWYEHGLSFDVYSGCPPPFSSDVYPITSTIAQCKMDAENAAKELLQKTIKKLEEYK